MNLTTSHDQEKGIDPGIDSRRAFDQRKDAQKRWKIQPQQATVAHNGIHLRHKKHFSW